LGPAGRAANIVQHAFLLMTKAGVWCGPAKIPQCLEQKDSLFSHCHARLRAPRLELPGPGPQGECKSLGRERSWLKLSFHAPKCPLDL